MKKHDTDLAEKGYDVMGKCARPSREPYSYHIGNSPLFRQLSDMELGLHFILRPTDIMPFQEEP